MSFGLGISLRHLHGQYRDRILTSLTILLLFLMFVVAPLQAAGSIVFEAFAFILGLVMIADALVMSGSSIAFVMMSVAFCMIGAAVISRLHKPSILNIYLLAGAWLIIAITFSSVVARAVFAPGRVTYHRIHGAILLYLLIAVIFMALYVFVSLLFPGAISGISFEDSPALASNLIYFSFTTLTTTGYGDIFPVHPLARSLSNLESIVGQLYPATLLARLVTLEIADRG
jgi:hypothetical protein